MLRLRRILYALVGLASAGVWTSMKNAGAVPCTGCGTPSTNIVGACGQPVPNDPACPGGPYYTYDRQWYSQSCSNGTRIYGCTFNKRGTCCSVLNEKYCPTGTCS